MHREGESEAQGKPLGDVVLLDKVYQTLSNKAKEYFLGSSLGGIVNLNLCLLVDIIYFAIFDSHKQHSEVTSTCMRERERQRQRETETERQRDTDRERQRETEIAKRRGGEISRT